jgi:apolipoprotein N-acyltransferase
LDKKVKYLFPVAVGKMSRDELTHILVPALLLGVAFPPFPFGFLVPIALYRFLGYIIDKTPTQSFRLGYWFGLFWSAVTLFWIAASTLTGAIFAITINALHYAILWWLFALVYKSSKKLAFFLLPFIWVVLEYLRLFTDLRFNWMTLAHTQTYYLSFIQIIDITGPLGISFILIILSELLYFFFQLSGKTKWIPLLSGLLIVGILSGYGIRRTVQLNEGEYPLINTAVVQPNVDPFQKWDPQFQEEAFNMLMESSQHLLNAQPKIIVWPETATPFFLRARFNEQRIIRRFVDSTQIYLLTGTPDYEFLQEKKEYKTYNAAFFFRPDTSGYEVYYKLALVPAAESMPFKETLPFLRKLDVGGGDFFPGKDKTVFNFEIPLVLGKKLNGIYQVDHQDSLKYKQVSLSTLICYESVFPQIVREFILNGANLLSIITNDGWFGMTNGPYQHAQFAVLRAIENRVSIIRCANTGISGFIDPTGNYLAKVPLASKKDLVTRLPILSEKTFYSKNGEWFGKMTLGVSLVLFFIKLIQWIINKFYHRAETVE